MTWQFVLIALSALMLFGFVALGVIKFDWRSCYSAYGPLWGEWWPKLNIWSVVTLLSAWLMIPVLLECSVDNPWQFTGFLAPVFLSLVAVSPNYQEGGFYNAIHQIGAWGGVAIIVLYTIFVNWHLVWIFAPLLIIAIILGLWKKGTILFWLEMAVYLSTYVILIAMAIPK